jgi:hypothetical protein
MAAVAGPTGSRHSRTATAAILLGGLMVWSSNPRQLLFVEQQDGKLANRGAYSGMSKPQY